MAALRRYRIMDTEPEEAFDRVVRLAQTLFGMPVALISLIDERRQWFKARMGIAVQETPRSWAFCNHAIQQQSPLVVTDAQKDPRFAANPLVLGEPFVRFYAGAPIRTPDHQAIGTVCVLSPTPLASFSEVDQERLTALADIVSHELELRRHTRLAEQYAGNMDVLVREVHHQVANSLQLVTDVLEFQRRSTRDRTVTAALTNAVGRIDAVGQVHQQLRRQGTSEHGDAKAYLGVLLRQLWRGLAPEAAERAIAIDVPDGLLLSAELLPRLGLAATELVTNAIRHGSGSVSVAVQRDDDCVVLTVADEGAGVRDGSATGTTRDRMGFQLIRMLAGDGSVIVDPDDPSRISVRIPT